MSERIIQYIKDLSPLFGPSTRESEVQRWLSRQLEGECHVYGDPLGNLWAQYAGDKGLRCALVAHADEIGVQLTNIEETGIARFRKIGALRATSLVGQRLRFRNMRNEDVIGIVGCDPMQDNGTDNGLLLRTSDLWVDIGAESKEEFESRLKIGDFGVFDVADVMMMPGHRVCGKALDDRAGLAVALDSFRESRAISGINTMLMSTVQEELSLYGAKGISVDADVAIVVDVDFCSDTPSAVGNVTKLDLGGGIGISVSADTSPVLLNMAKDISEEEDIPIQITLGRNFSGGTDAAALRLKNATATIVISIPLRYMHTAREIADTRDIMNAGKFVQSMLCRLASLNDKTDLIPWK